MSFSAADICMVWEHESLCGMVANEVGVEMVKSEFELHLRYYVHFRVIYYQIYPCRKIVTVLFNP